MVEPPGHSIDHCDISSCYGNFVLTFIFLDTYYGEQRANCHVVQVVVCSESFADHA